MAADERSLRHRLPPLNALLVFEAAARTLNFTRAAAELHITQAAVSKQVKSLEQHLGLCLFERIGRRVALTAEGVQLQQKVSASFNFLASSLEELRQTPAVSQINMAANSAVSHYWLGQQLDQHHLERPGTAIHMLTSDSTDQLLSPEIDVAVVYDVANKPGWQLIPLFGERLSPVASPDYWQQHPLQDAQLEALAGHTLLDFEQIEPNWINWRAWQALCNQPVPTPTAGGYTNYIVLIDAVIRGRGVALASLPLLQPLIDAGQLQPLEPLTIDSGRHYSLAVNRQRPHTPQRQRLVQWLSECAAKL